MNKTIWMCWFQGEDDVSLPALNRECIRRWRSLNPDWQVNVLDYTTIADFVPEFHRIIDETPFSRGRLSLRSDLLRVLLLEKYGGVWVDSSVYPTSPLSDFYDKVVNHTGFFTYRFMPRATSKRETVSWFLCARYKNHPLIKKWREEFVFRFTTRKNLAYYVFHKTLSYLYDSDKEVRETIDNMVQLSAGSPHSACRRSRKRNPSYMYKRPYNVKTLS